MQEALGHGARYELDGNLNERVEHEWHEENNIPDRKKEGHLPSTEKRKDIYLSDRLQIRGITHFVAITRRHQGELGIKQGDYKRLWLHKITE